MTLWENMKGKFWLLAFSYWLLAFSLTVYSYSQIDLNLTLSSNKLYQSFQQQLIHLGYFNRPLSTLLYLILVLLLFTFYFLLLSAVRRRKIDKKQVWFLILVTAGILLFSYPAFSHDIFNYIFDSRILLHYQANPWVKTALDFPQDNWTRFMHWTHRTYPYGPFWLLASAVPYGLGLGKFVLTLFNFKLQLALSFLGSSYLIYKIALRNDKKNALFSLVFFAFNPLIIIESLVSPHLDILMTFFGLLALFLLMHQNKVLGIVSLVVSFLTKYATAGYLPILINHLSWSRRFFWTTLLTGGAILGQVYLRELLPWYFIPLVAIVSLTTQGLLKIIIMGLSLGAVLYYLPYLYLGEYNPLVKSFRLYLFFLPIFISTVFGFFNKKLRSQ